MTASRCVIHCTVARNPSCRKSLRPYAHEILLRACLVTAWLPGCLAQWAASLEGCHLDAYCLAGTCMVAGCCPSLIAHISTPFQLHAPPCKVMQQHLKGPVHILPYSRGVLLHHALLPAADAVVGGPWWCSALLQRCAAAKGEERVADSKKETPSPCRDSNTACRCQG